MRIIAGSLGGRQFDSPHGHRTHPMSDKIRGALFNILGDIEGLTVLDAFTGSGAIAFEAISRGAKHVVALDIDKGAITTVVKSANALGISSRIKAIRVGAGPWLRTQKASTFDIVICDPPYDNIQDALLLQLADRAEPGGLVVLSLPPSCNFRLLTSKYELLSSKSYGDAQLFVYRANVAL